MNRWAMLCRIIAKSVWLRPGRASGSLAALTVGATLASAFLSLYFDLPRKMTAEFRTLGANLLLAPRDGEATLPEDASAKLVNGYPEIAQVPWLYAAGKVGDQEVIFAGTDMEQAASLNPTWRVTAVAEKDAGQKESSAAFETFLKEARQENAAGGTEWLLAGETTAAHFGWSVGDPVELRYGRRTLTLPLAGVLSTGGSEDSQLLVPLPALQLLTDLEGRLSLIQARARGSAAQVESARKGLASLIPEAEVRPLRQVVESEARVVMKVRGLMFGLTAIVLGIVMLSVMTTASGLVLDRQREIGVMKALGASDATVSLLFVAETSLYALLAAVAGYLAGFGLAQWAAQRIFHSALQWRWDVLPAVAAVTLAVALIGTALPVRWVRRLNPALILRSN